MYLYLQWYLGHSLTCNLSDGADMRRAKRALYYGTNLISARVGYTDKHILVKLLKAYCSSIYGCELWYLPGEKRACLKKTSQAATVG